MMEDALVKLGHSLACVKIWGCSTLGAEIWSSKNRLERARFDTEISVVSRPKFTRLPSLNARGIAVNQVLVRFRTSSFVPKIFVTEV